MFKKTLMAHRGDNGPQAAAATPDCIAREACTGGSHQEKNRV